MTAPTRTARLAWEPLLTIAMSACSSMVPTRRRSLLTALHRRGLRAGRSGVPHRYPPRIARCPHRRHPGERRRYRGGRSVATSSRSAPGPSRTCAAGSSTDLPSSKYVQEALDAGRRMGFPRTRLIGSTRMGARRRVGARPDPATRRASTNTSARSPTSPSAPYDLTRHNARIDRRGHQRPSRCAHRRHASDEPRAGRASARDLLRPPRRSSSAAGVQAHRCRRHHRGLGCGEGDVLPPLPIQGRSHRRVAARSAHALVRLRLEPRRSARRPTRATRSCCSSRRSRGGSRARDRVGART